MYAEGQISVEPSLQSAASKIPTLFIMAKAPEMKGAPLAVKRIDHPQFPLNFSLTQADSPFGDNFYDGDLVVTARLDQDGAAGPKQPGDIESLVRINKGSDRSAVIVLK